MTQLQGFFEKNFTLSPDYCGASARMSPLAAFTMFQAIAAEHAERIGVGGAAMARRGAFWLTLHSRVDFFRWPALAQEVTAATKRVEACFSTAQEETAQMTGGDYNRNVRQRAIEVRRKREVDEIANPPQPAAPAPGQEPPPGKGKEGQGGEGNA